jgi:hypothetical protein
MNGKIGLMGLSLHRLSTSPSIYRILTSRFFVCFNYFARYV